MALVVLPLLACGDDSESSAPAGPLPTATPMAAAVNTEKAVDQALGNAPAAATLATASGQTPAATGVKHFTITNDDFLDAPEHRDPFAPFELPKQDPVVATPTEPLVNLAPVPKPEDIAFADTDLGDLKCQMILAMAGEKPRAYLLGPDNANRYVTQGEYVGRAIRAGANEPDVFWRVYEIEEGGVSFELSNATGQEGDTGARPALRLYTNDEVTRFEHLFSLR